MRIRRWSDFYQNICSVNAFSKKMPYWLAATRFFLQNWTLHFENGHFVKMEKCPKPKREGSLHLSISALLGFFDIKNINNVPQYFPYAPEMTPDVSWIQEEETLLALNTIPPKEVLTSIAIDFLFVNSDADIVRVLRRTQTLDVSGNISRLPKESILLLIRNAKEEFGSAGKYVLEDILVWNAGVEPDHLFQYAESDDPTAIGTEFTRGSIFYDLVFMPSVFVFHPNQQMFVVFRESKEKETNKTTTKHKGTKRVRFFSGGTTRRLREPTVPRTPPLGTE